MLISNDLESQLTKASCRLNVNKRIQMQVKNEWEKKSEEVDREKKTVATV